MGERAPQPPLPEETPPEQPEEGQARVIRLAPASEEERQRIRQQAGQYNVVAPRTGAAGVEYRPGETAINRGGKRRRGDESET